MYLQTVYYICNNPCIIRISDSCELSLVLYIWRENRTCIHVVSPPPEKCLLFFFELVHERKLSVGRFFNGVNVPRC